MVTVATAAKASLALGVPRCDAITACALHAELGPSAAGELDSAGGHVGVLRVALSLLPHLFFSCALEMAADRVDNRFWGCNTRVVVCGPAIETELGLEVKAAPSHR